MRSEWISGSAAMLTLGGLSLVLGFSFNPLPQDRPLAEAAVLAAEQPGMWLMTTFMLFLAAIGLSLGCLAVLFMTRTKHQRRLPAFTVVVFLVGMIGMAGHAMLMAFVRAMVLTDPTLAANLDAIGKDVALQSLLLTWSIGLLGGVFLIGVGVFRARSAPRWIPMLMWAFVLSQFINVPGQAYTTLQFVALAVALTGVAMAANEQCRDREFLDQQKRPASSGRRDRLYV